MNRSSPGKIPRRVLGRTGLDVSCIGLGGMGVIFKANEQRESALELLNTAIDGGMNFIDTAVSYFDSEEIIGEVLKDRKDEFVIATKTYQRTAKRAEKEILESFRRLQTDYIHLYQCHHVQYWNEFEQITSRGGALDVLRSLQKEGKIGFIGVSSHNPEILPRILESDIFDTVQFPFSPVEREYYSRLRDVMTRRNIGSIIMKPLAGGNLKSVDKALRYLLSHDVSTIIPGCTTVEQVKENIRVGVEFTGITEEEKQTIIEEAGSLPEKFCRRCRYCEKVCSRGIPISDIFRCEDYLILSATYAREQYRALGKTVKDCGDCGACESICPYHLPVREKLMKAHKRLTRGALEDFVVKTVRKLGIYDLARTIYFKLGGKLPER